MKTRHFAGGRALLVLAAVFALGTAARVEADDGITLSGHVQQSASGAMSFSGNPSPSGGAASSLALALDASRGSTSFRASVHFALLYGNEAASLWSSFLLAPGKGLAFLMAPAFDALSPAPETIALFALDDLALSWDSGAFAFEAGKTYANWGLGKAFSPADFFAEFDYSSGSPARLSKLIARATWFPGATSRVDLVYDPYAVAGSTIAARAYIAAYDSLAFSAAAGLRAASGTSPRSFLGAIEATFDLPFATPYGEAALALPLDGSAAPSWSLLGGGVARIGEATILGEYLFSPEASEKHSIFSQIGVPIDEWVSFSLPVLYYPESGILAAGITLSASDLAGLDLGLSASANRSASQSWSGKFSITARSAF